VPISEAALIERFFRNCGASRADVAVAIGDDAAVVSVPSAAQLVAATDTLVAGVHFPLNSPPASIGHRALAVNLSDLAAMGARPAWALLALTLPEAREEWLGEFAAGFSALARAHEVALIGGDTTKGPLCVTVQLLGYVPSGTALTRGGAHAGDALFVSGTPGDAGAGLALEQGRLMAPSAAGAYLRQRFLQPTPRVTLGQRLRAHASACIDISDGLLGDAGKLASASSVGVAIAEEQLPLSGPLREVLDEPAARRLALSAGDDYELCFAVPESSLARLEHELPAAQWGYTRIGTLRSERGAVVTRAGAVIEFSHSGYQHFG
jgi:thiamine-monophosphate kinase